MSPVQHHVPSARGQTGLPVGGSPITEEAATITERLVPPSTHTHTMATVLHNPFMFECLEVMKLHYAML